MLMNYSQNTNVQSCSPSRYKNPNQSRPNTHPWIHQLFYNCLYFPTRASIPPRHSISPLPPLHLLFLKMFTDAASTKSLSPISSVSSLSAMSEGSALVYIAPEQLPSPKATAITFDTTEHIEPLDLTKKLGDDEILNEDKFVTHVLAFSFQNPTRVHVKIETELLEDSHCTREVESKADAANVAAKLADAAPTLLRNLRAGESCSHVGQQLDILYKALCSVYGPATNTNTNQEDQDENTPPASPITTDEPSDWSHHSRG